MTVLLPPAFFVIFIALLLAVLLSWCRKKKAQLTRHSRSNPQKFPGQIFFDPR